MDPNRSFNIPEEILFIILTMLPVKSLCRFKCVSKHWFSVISNPNFVAAHSSQSKSRPKLLISVTREAAFHESGDDEMNFYSVDYPEDNHESSNLHAIAHASVSASPYTEVNSTNGLICCTCDQGINIVNLFTGEFNLIQSDKLYERFCLGFDPIDKKLAILMVEDIRHAPMKSSVFPLQESKWHDIHSTQPFYQVGKSVICVNGFIYFTALAKPRDYSERLYAFDVRSESLELIEYPPNPFFMVEYKGRLALLGSENYIVYGRTRPLTNEIEVWILEDPKKKHSWRFKSFVVPWKDDILESGAMLVQLIEVIDICY